jgi:drug/metabolite transporter (DMT)-like permease
MIINFFFSRLFFHDSFFTTLFSRLFFFVLFFAFSKKEKAKKKKMDWIWIIIVIVIIVLIFGTVWFYKLVFNFFKTLFTPKAKGGHEDYNLEDFDY